MRSGAFPSHSYMKILVLSLISCCISVSLLLLLSQPQRPALGQGWGTDSLVLLGVLALQTVGMALSRRLALSLALLFSGLVLVILLGLPFGDWLPLKLALWSLLVLESGAFLDPPLSLVSQAVCLAVIVLFQGRLSVWGQVIRGPGPVELLTAGAFMMALAAVVHFLRIFSSVIDRQEEQLARLDEAVRQLTRANLSFQNLASSAQERSAADERKRITREIHDAIGYALTNLIMTMEACLRLVSKDEEKLRVLLARAREEAQLGLNETRKVLRVLREEVPARARGLSAIHRLVTLFSNATGVTVKTEYCNASLSFGEEMDLAIFRMIQEGLTNAFRHGHANEIKVKFWQERDGITITFWDNGVGGDIIKEGIGLQGMRERVEQIGGTVQAYRTADGFELRTWLPLDGGAARERTVVYGQDIPALGG